jgi:cyclohexanone monooxygenase
MTGALLNIDISVDGGPRLRDKWAHGPRTYLGLMTAGFPNLFMITGPGSPSVKSNMIASIEQHVDWIADCLRHLDDKEIRQIEADEGAENSWVDHVNQVADATLYPQANSWYNGANIAASRACSCLMSPGWISTERFVTRLRQMITGASH